MQQARIRAIIKLAGKAGNSKKNLSNFAISLIVLDEDRLKYLHFEIVNRRGVCQDIDEAVASRILQGVASQLRLRGKLKEMNLEEALVRVGNKYQILAIPYRDPGVWVYHGRKFDRTMAVLRVRHRTMDPKGYWSIDLLCKIWGVWYLCDSQQADSLIPLEADDWFAPMSEREIKWEKKLLSDDSIPDQPDIS